MSMASSGRRNGIIPDGSRGSGVTHKQCEDENRQAKRFPGMQTVRWKSGDGKRYCSGVHCA